MVLGEVIKTCSNSSQKLSFTSSLFSSLGACTFRIMMLHQRPLRTIYYILSLINSTLLTANAILWCTKKTCSQLMVSNSLAAAISERTLYRLLTFHVPNRMSLFCFLKLRDTPSGRTEWGSSSPPD